MSVSVNKTILIGNIGQTPQISTLNDIKVGVISLATNETWKNKEGEKVTKTAWHRLVAWRWVADFVEKYVKKGDKIYIEGKLGYRNYEKDGIKRTISEITISEIRLLSNKQEKTTPKENNEDDLIDTKNGKLSKSLLFEPNGDDDLPF